MNVKRVFRRQTEVTIDRVAVTLAVLFMVVLVPAVWLALNVPLENESNIYGFEGATLGGLWVVAEAAFAGLLVGLLYLWKYLPEWIQDWAKYSILILIALLLGVGIWTAGIFWLAYGLGIVGAFVAFAIIEYHLWWIVNNLLAVLIAIWLAVVAGDVFGVEALLVALVGLSVYDWYFADKKKWMFSMFSVMVKYYAPVMFIIPAKPRIDFEALAESYDDDLPEWVDEAEPSPSPEERAEEVGIAMGIGMADLALPAMFAVAVALSPTGFAIAGVPAGVIGVAVGVVVACFRLRWKVLEYENGAGMPPLATGAIAGYAPFWLVGALVAAL